MNALKKILSSFWDNYIRSAPAGMITTYVLGLIFILYYKFGGGSADFLICGAVMLAVGFFVQTGYCFSGPAPGHNSDFVSDYDRSVIGSSFRFGGKKQLFFSGLEKLRSGDLNEALDDFRELNEKALTDSEQGVLSFYTCICYNHMGYPTNAAHCAAEAADKGICATDALLMAARNFSLAGSRAMAEEYYEKLLPLAEEKRIFPFLYNEMGKMYITSEKPAKARSCFEKAISEGLDPVTAQGGMALVCLMEKRDDEACEWYRLALISRIPDSDGYKKYCGEICTANGYPEDYLETHLREKYEKKRTAECSAE